jgi:hypothetical protein
VHDRVRAQLGDECLERLVVARDVELGEPDALAADLLPRPEADVEGLDGRQRLRAELGVCRAPGEVVDDVDVVSTG